MTQGPQSNIVLPYWAVVILAFVINQLMYSREWLKLDISKSAPVILANSDSPVRACCQRIPMD